MTGAEASCSRSHKTCTQLRCGQSYRMRWLSACSASWRSMSTVIAAGDTCALAVSECPAIQPDCCTLIWEITGSIDIVVRGRLA